MSKIRDLCEDRDEFRAKITHHALQVSVNRAPNNRVGRGWGEGGEVGEGGGGGGGGWEGGAVGENTLRKLPNVPKIRTLQKRT